MKRTGRSFDIAASTAPCIEAGVKSGAGRQSRADQERGRWGVRTGDALGQNRSGVKKFQGKMENDIKRNLVSLKEKLSIQGDR